MITELDGGDQALEQMGEIRLKIQKVMHESCFNKNKVYQMITSSIQFTFILIKHNHYGTI